MAQYVQNNRPKEFIDIIDEAVHRCATTLQETPSTASIDMPTEEEVGTHREWIDNLTRGRDRRPHAFTPPQRPTPYVDRHPYEGLAITPGIGIYLPTPTWQADEWDERWRSSLHIEDPIDLPWVHVFAQGHPSTADTNTPTRSGWRDAKADDAFALLHYAVAHQPWVVVSCHTQDEPDVLRGQVWRLLDQVWTHAGFTRCVLRGDAQVFVVAWRKDLIERWGYPAPPETPTFDTILNSVRDYLRPQSSFVPRSIDEVVDERTVAAYRGHMAQAFDDFKELQRQGRTDDPPGAEVSRKRKWKGRQAPGGLVLDDPAPIPMFLADYWMSGNPDDIVPVQSLRGQAGFNQLMLGLLTRAYSDREAATALTGAGVPSKDARGRTRSLLATNHQGSLNHHRFVDKMFMGETTAGRMHMFGIQQCPVIMPSFVTPMGAVTKKTRDGKIDTEAMRPTADLSWPPTGYWLQLLVDSPNATVNLDRDFPYIFMISASDLIDQILSLRYRASIDGHRGVR